MFKKKEQPINRFIVVHEEHVTGIGFVSILKDQITGVQYLHVSNGDGNSLTPLLSSPPSPTSNSS